MSLYIGNKKINQVSVVFTQGDTSQLAAENIKAGSSILGIVGTFTDDSTLSGGETIADSENIMEGYAAFANGQKVEGTLEVNKYYTGSTEPSSSLGNNGDIYLKK